MNTGAGVAFPAFVEASVLTDLIEGVQVRRSMSDRHIVGMYNTLVEVCEFSLLLSVLQMGIICALHGSGGIGSGLRSGSQYPLGICPCGGSENVCS